MSPDTLPVAIEWAALMLSVAYVWAAYVRGRRK